MIYLAASTGSASFDFEACADLNNDGDTLDAGECDTGTISITVDSFTAPPAPVAPEPEDQELLAPVGGSVIIDLMTGIGDGSVENQDSIGTPENPGGSHAALSPAAEVAQGAPANLEIQGFSAPACAALGETIGAEISVIMTNNGGTAIAPGTSVASVGFYISTDSTITTSDTLLTGGREFPIEGGLGIGETIADFLAASAGINTGSPTGSVFIGVVADESNDITESDETDNTGAQAITIEAVACPAAPDLVISNLFHTPPDPSGFGSVAFTAIVKNDGDATAVASTLCLAIDALGEDCNSTAALFSVPSLAAGATHTEVRNEDIAVGSGFQNTAVADINDVVAESDENNNTAFDTFGVGTGASLMTATITSLPTLGTLSGITAASEGVSVPITTVPTDLTGTSVSYTAATTGTASFGYTITDTSSGLTSAAAQIDLTITQIIDPCVAVGREPGCTPNQ